MVRVLIRKLYVPNTHRVRFLYIGIGYDRFHCASFIRTYRYVRTNIASGCDNLPIYTLILRAYFKVFENKNNWMAIQLI